VGCSAQEEQPEEPPPPPRYCLADCIRTDNASRAGGAAICSEEMRVATQRSTSVGVVDDRGGRVLDGRRDRKPRRTIVCTSPGDAGTAADAAGSRPPTVSSGAVALGGGEEEPAGAAELGSAWRSSLSDGGSAASVFAAAACSLSVCTIITLWKPSAAVGCSCVPLSMRRTTASADLPSTPPARHHTI
jgi:hypothetical protein